MNAHCVIYTNYLKNKEKNIFQLVTIYILHKDKNLFNREKNF